TFGAFEGIELRRPGAATGVTELEDPTGGLDGEDDDEDWNEDREDEDRYDPDDLDDEFDLDE
ncbi:MAG: hypothetical protein ACYTFT_17590, partial [Planctomycetota bacterium]